MWVIYNGGAHYTVTAITPSPTGKTLVTTQRNDATGKEYSKTYRTTAQVVAFHPTGAK